MAEKAPKRITILAFASYGMGCPCYEQYSFRGGSILPFFVRGLRRTDPSPPRVHGGAFSLTGYFTGRRINTYEWYAALGYPDAKPDEGADYEWRHLESIAEMRQLGIPFCKTENRCFDWPKELPSGACSRELVSKKAHLLDWPDLVNEWDAAQIRYLLGSPADPNAIPSQSISLETWHRPDIQLLASRLGAKSFESKQGSADVSIPDADLDSLDDSEDWIFHFDDTESAIDAVQRALCDPSVEAARMSAVGSWQRRYHP
jgi:hypothetical protein